MFNGVYHPRTFSRDFVWGYVKDMVYTNIPNLTNLRQTIISSVVLYIEQKNDGQRVKMCAEHEELFTH